MNAPDPAVVVRDELPDLRSPTRKAMRTTTINGIGRTVSAIGFGSMHLSIDGCPSSIDGRPSRDEAIEVVHHALDLGVTFVPLGGRRRAKNVGDYAVLSEIADAKGASPHQVAIAWLVAKSPVVLPIPGASRKEALEDPIRALEVSLSEAGVDRIEREIE